jgi:UDP-N-acetylmuramoyl-tripeptide--D-alanyl-D-alanine ligase
MELQKIYNYFSENKCKVVTDSRQCMPGDIFIGLKGENFDGNLFSEQAIKLGCKFAITENANCKTYDSIILVDNSLIFLQKFANLHRRTIGIPILAITGSNGKTTTKELIASVLKKKYNLGFTKGNFNNHIGVPLTLLSFSKETEIGVVEMGANHPGEIKDLCNIAEPDFGIITNIGKAHIEGFGSFQGVINTKSELYEYLNTKNGIVFYNSQNELLSSLKKKNPISFGSKCDLVFGQITESNPFLKIEVTIEDKIIEINSKLFGTYNLENILAAICIGKYFGISNQLVKESIEHYYPENARSQLLKTKNNTLFLDAYNANPSSMEKAIENFITISGKKIMILGDMLELGDTALTEHKKIAISLIPETKIEVYLVGNIFSSLNYTQFKSFENVEALISHFQINRIEGHNILIKGSRGIKLEKIIDYL